MTINNSEAAGNAFPVWGDLYALYRFLIDAPSVPSHRVYFQNLRGQQFERPSFLLKVVVERNRSRNIATRWSDMDIMIRYHADTEWDAVGVAGQVVELFSGFPEALVPKWDFSTSPPTRISISGIDQYGQSVPATMGIRISPDTVRSQVDETEDQRWQAVIEFTAVSPRQAHLTLQPFITSASYELINYALDPPQYVEMSMNVSQTATVI